MRLLSPAAERSPGPSPIAPSAGRPVGIALAWAALVLSACSDTEIRVVYEPPTFYEQPAALGPTRWVDEFQQRTVQKSDILFVVDNSGSMGDDQEELAANFDQFISSFSGSTLDWHVGVVAGDLEPGNENEWGRLREYQGERWVHPGTPDPVTAFNAMANIGANGSGECEMGLEASFSALGWLTGNGQWNAGFYREDALLSIVIVSDEIDHAGESSPFGGCEGIGPDEYIPWLLYNLKGYGSSDMVHFTGIIGDRPNGCETADNSADAGDGYWEVIDAVGGNFHSLCSADWGTFLYGVGLEAAGLKSSFRLRRVPAEGTIEVRWDGVAVEGGTWTYDRVRNSVEFEVANIPPPLTVVEVEYVLAEDASAAGP